MALEVCCWRRGMIRALVPVMVESIINLWTWASIWVWICHRKLQL